MDYKVKLFPGVQAPDMQNPRLPNNNGIVAPGGVKAFLNDEECQRLKNLSEDIAPIKQSKTGDGASDVKTDHRISTHRTIFPGNPEVDWFFDKLEKRIIQMNGSFKFEIGGFFEGAQIYNYPEGGFLGWHMDIGLEHMSTRKLSMTIQLSDGDDYDGGDLEFMDFNHGCPRGKGDLIVFPSYLQHRVTNITRGDRDCVVTWVHGLPFR